VAHTIPTRGAQPAVQEGHSLLWQVFLHFSIFLRSCTWSQ